MNKTYYDFDIYQFGFKLYKFIDKEEYIIIKPDGNYIWKTMNKNFNSRQEINKYVYTMLLTPQQQNIIKFQNDIEQELK